MRVWGGALAVDGEKLFMAMKILPFGVGLLAGVPIVARELEMRTAQTAWSLNGSRLRWLIRQVAPIGGVVALAIAVRGGGCDRDPGRPCRMGPTGVL
jgi:hypothetical protein